MRLGCTVSSSLARGQGASADQQDRFRYVDRRDEMMAHGLADLGRERSQVSQSTLARDTEGDNFEGGNLLLNDLHALHQDCG